MIVALIPLKDGHVLSTEVLLGLTKQTIPIVLLCVSRPREDLVDYPATVGWVSMTKCRNILREEALALYPNQKYFLLLNRDVILEHETILEKMIDFLDTNEEYGCLAVDTRGADTNKLLEESRHFDIAFMVVRNYILTNVSFDNEKGCNCNSFCDNVKKLDKQNRIKYYVL